MPKKPAAKARKAGKLETPEHGVGKLWRGKAAGHVPGSGRPTNELRAKMRGQLGTVLEEIDELMQKREPCEECGRRFTDNDMVRLGDFLAKYGIGTVKAGIDEALMRALAADVAAEVEGDEVLKRIRDRWVMTLGAHATGRG
jgi:hypothetical protein